jgi:hypothetical protein
MSLSRKKQIATKVQMDFDMTDELAYAEHFALESAFRFLVGGPWNMDDIICETAIHEELDGDLIWLASNVLFAPAVVNIATGKPV